MHSLASLFYLPPDKFPALPDLERLLAFSGSDWPNCVPDSLLVI